MCLHLSLSASTANDDDVDDVLVVVVVDTSIVCGCFGMGAGTSDLAHVQRHVG